MIHLNARKYLLEESSTQDRREKRDMFASNAEITLGVIRSIPEAIPRLKESRVAFKVLRRDLCNLFRARNCRVKLANSPGEASRGSGQQTACTCQLSSARNGRYLGFLIPASEHRLTAQFNSLISIDFTDSSLEKLSWTDDWIN